MIIWKNCFLNLTIVPLLKLRCFLKHRKSDWYSFHQVHFLFWTTQKEQEYFKKLDKAVKARLG